MIMKEKRDINPVLIKIGIVSAFSLIGILYSFFNSATKTNKPSGSSSANSPENQSDQSDSSMAAKDESSRANDHLLQASFEFGNSDLIVRVEDVESPSHSRVSVDSFTGSYPSSNESACDRNVYLLPEYNEFLKEHDLAVVKDSSTSDNTMPNQYEVEITGLRHTVETQNERIRSLEMKLLEYHGIKEQEGYVFELQNRLKINHMETKILQLKNKALMADKKRLEDQMTELETAKSKIKALEKELTRETQQNKAYLLALRDRVAKLQDDELQAISNSEVQLMAQKTKDLEDEIERLKKTNRSLEEENSALSHKVEYLQNFAASALEDEQIEAVKKENIDLRQKTEDLASQIERLEAAHCTDVEELVYLRWINACLRYELRNHKPDGTGKTAARDLSRSLSPKSEEKAKQLILEYAQKEGKGISFADFDLEHWSSPHSYLTEDSDHEGDDESSLDLSSTNQSDIIRNSKIFGKLMRLVRGKHGRSRRQSANSCIGSEVRRCSSDIAGVVDSIRSRTSPEVKPNKLTLDMEKITHFRFQEQQEQQQRRLRNSHDGSSYMYRVVGTISSGHEDDHHNRNDLEDDSKADLVKYAEALKGSAHQKTHNRKRAASCSSFKHM